MGRLEAEQLTVRAHGRLDRVERSACKRGNDELRRLIGDDARKGARVQDVTVHGLAVECLGAAAANRHGLLRGRRGTNRLLHCGERGIGHA
jgi:hypothetical protein